MQYETADYDALKEKYAKKVDAKDILLFNSTGFIRDSFYTDTIRELKLENDTLYYGIGIPRDFEREVMIVKIPDPNYRQKDFKHPIIAGAIKKKTLFIHSVCQD